LLKARHDDLHYIWVIYSDGPGNKGRGGSGVTCLLEDDLLGLIGKHPTQKDAPRWVGGLGPKPFRDSHRYRRMYKSVSSVLSEVYACTFLSSTPLSWGCGTILSSRWLPSELCSQS
jgi:hypothetical protein